MRLYQDRIPAEYRDRHEGAERAWVAAVAANERLILVVRVNGANQPLDEWPSIWTMLAHRIEHENTETGAVVRVIKDRDAGPVEPAAPRIPVSQARGERVVRRAVFDPATGVQVNVDGAFSLPELPLPDLRDTDQEVQDGRFQAAPDPFFEPVTNTRRDVHFDISPRRLPIDPEPSGFTVIQSAAPRPAPRPSIPSGPVKRKML